jgi:tRNA dimethylallyltransferase
MDIGTGKASAAERARIRHHGLDVVAPDEIMTAARFVAIADAAIEAAGKAVVAGGTGLYVRALLRGLFEGPPADEELRARLAALGQPALRARLERDDPEAAAKIEPNDQLRTIRALEVLELTGTPISAHHRAHDRGPRYDARIIGLEPPKDVLHRAIDARVEQMIAAGFVDEVRALLAAGYASELRSFGAIGYREVCAHLRGELPLDEAIRAIQRASRKYARRQLTWFRAEPGVTWYKSPADVDVPSLAAWLS